MKPDNVTLDVEWEGDLDENVLWSAVDVFIRRCGVPAQAAIDILLADDARLAEFEKELLETHNPNTVSGILRYIRTICPNQLEMLNRS